MAYTGVVPSDPDTDWASDTPYDQYPPWLRPTMPMADLNPAAGPMRGGFNPYSGPDNPLTRSPYADEQFVPSVAAAGVSGLGNSAQPPANLSTTGPGRGAAQVMAKKSPPPGMSPNVATGPTPQGPPPLPNMTARSAPPGSTIAPATNATPASAVAPTTPAPPVATDLAAQIKRDEDLLAQPRPEMKTKGAMSVIQRLGMALLAATKLAPYAQQITHPIYSQQVAQRQAAGEELKELSAAQEAQQRGEWYGAQAAEGKGRYLRVGTGVFDQAAGKWVTPPADRSNLVAVPVATAQAAGLDVSQQENGRIYLPAAVANQLIKPAKSPNDFIEITPESGKKLGLVPDKDGKYTIPKEGISSYLTQTGKPTAPPNAEQQKVAFQGALSKLEAAGVRVAGQDINKQSAAIRNAPANVLTPEEKFDALGYLGANSTPAQQFTIADQRAAGMAERTPISVIDTTTGQALTMNMEDFNQIHQREPGRYVASTVAAPAMQKQATFEDIQYNIDNARNAIQQLGTLDAGTRAELVNALSSESSEGLGGNIGAFLRGQAATTMTPQQRNAVISLKNLMENALALRSIAGYGQGSDQMRNAILSTLPNGKSADVPYMLEQMRQFEGIVQRLHQGVPKLGGQAAGQTPGQTTGGGGNKGGGGRIGGGAPPIVQHSPSTGAYRYSLDGGKTWQPGRPPQQ